MPFAITSLPQVGCRFNTELRAMTTPMMRSTLVNRYRCASCWGVLVERYREGSGWVVECAADPGHAGFVTQTFVESRRRLNILEAAEVGSRYAKILGLARPDLKAASRALYGDE